MNFLDIVLIAVVAFFTLRGVMRGLVKEVVFLGAIALALFAARRLQPLLAPHLGLYLDNEQTVAAASYALVFLAVLLASWLLARFLRSVLEVSLLGWVDRLAGAVFGFAEGAVLCLVGLMLLMAFLPNNETLANSTIAPRARPAVGQLARLAPTSLRQALEEHGMTLPEAPPDAGALLDSVPDGADADPAQ